MDWKISLSLNFGFKSSVYSSSCLTHHLTFNITKVLHIQKIYLPESSIFHHLPVSSLNYDNKVLILKIFSIKLFFFWYFYFQFFCNLFKWHPTSSILISPHCQFCPYFCLYSRLYLVYKICKSHLWKKMSRNFNPFRTEKAATNGNHV